MPSASQKPLKLHITSENGGRYLPLLRRQLRRAHRLLQPRLTELSVALVGDAHMSKLHKQFLNIPGPTDVLTFPLELAKGGQVVAGEVVVCVPEARRRAKIEGVAVERELLLYALHGMLHLCGFDDRTASGYAEMHRTEDDILKQLGVGPVFARGADVAPSARHIGIGAQARPLNGRRATAPKQALPARAPRAARRSGAKG